MSVPKVPIERALTDVSPKVAIIPIVGALAVIVQAIVSGEFNSPEVTTAVSFVIATVVAYFKKDAISAEV